MCGLQRTGSITYNGATFDKFVPERTSAYVTQYDEHMAELTVRETLDFSRRVQGAGNRPGAHPYFMFVVHVHLPCAHDNNAEFQVIHSACYSMATSSSTNWLLGCMPDADSQHGQTPLKPAWLLCS